MVAGIAALVAVQNVAMGQDGPHVLSESGGSLGTMESGGQLDDLRVKVASGSDDVGATHVWAVIGGAALRQRTVNGYWVPWSGDPADLVDNGFKAQDGVIDFKVVDGSIAADNQGITFVIGYRVGETLKYGALAVVPKLDGDS